MPREDVLRGYDIDGVLTAGVQPTGNYVIVSGRTFAEYDDFAKQAAQLAPLYIRGVGAYGDRVHAAAFKAIVIGMLGIDEFYEDDQLQVQLIEEQCPGCTVVHVTKV